MIKNYKRELKFNYFIKQVIKNNDFEQLLDYLEENKYIPRKHIIRLMNIVCISKDPYYLFHFSVMARLNVDDLNTIGLFLSKTNEPHYIKKFILEHLGLEIEKKLLIRLCELGDIKELSTLLKNKNISKGCRRNIIETIIAKGNSEQLKILTKCPEYKQEIISKVCESSNSYCICLFSILFEKEDKTPFIEAMCKTNDAEMLYCFIKYNTTLHNEQLEPIVNVLLNTNNVEYIYKTLLILEGKSIELQKRCFKKIKQINDKKYLLFAAIYMDLNVYKSKFNSYQELYEEVLASNLFNSIELNNIHDSINMSKVKQ